MISPRYQVATYQIKEQCHYPINIVLNYEGQSGTEKTLFKSTTDYSKVFSFNIKQISPLTVTLVQKAQRDVGICTLQIPAMKPRSEKFEGKVSIELDRNGLIQIKEISMSEEVKYQEKVPKQTEKKPEKEGEPKEENKEPEYDMVEKTRSDVTSLKYNHQPHFGLGENEVNTFKDQEGQFLNRDNLVKETSNAKYLLESYIYKTREAIEMGQNQYLITPSEKQSIHNALNNEENWLYSEGVNTGKEDY